MKLFIRKICLTSFLFCLTCFCYSQKEKIISAGISSGYGFGGEINNLVTTIKLNYYPSQEIRIVPSFSFYLNNDYTNMNIFSFNFNYLFPDLISDFFSITQNKGITFYPVAGFCVANIKSRGTCSTCSKSSSTSSYFYKFGFDLGAGIDYDLPTLLPVFKDMTVNFELQYQILENYTRSQLMVGLIYNF
jgi:opacity protein-like surface antigen